MREHRDHPERAGAGTGAAGAFPPPLRALTLQQPWAWAVLHAGKDVENRGRRTHYRGRLLIHAGQGTAPEGFTFLRQLGVAAPDKDDLVHGAFIGWVTVTDCKPRDEVNSPWAFGPWCYLLSNPEPFARPYRATGKLGLFRPEPAFTDAAEREAFVCEVLRAGPAGRNLIP